MAIASKAAGLRTSLERHWLSLRSPLPWHLVEVAATAKKRARFGKSIPEMEAELYKMYSGMSAISGRGDSPIFKKIRSMADSAKKVLDDATAASSEEERRDILEAGMRYKTEWLAALHGQQTDIEKEKEEEEASSPARIIEQQLAASDNLVRLVQNNFTNFIAANPHAMVKFYAPWCGHCKKFAPEYARIAKAFKGRVGFAVVDGSEETRLMSVFNVSGYPTLRWFVKGNSINYEGPRSEQKITPWIESRLKPAFVDIDSAQDIETVMAASNGNRDGQALLCSGVGDKDSALFKAFQAAAEHFRGQLVFVWAPLPPSGEEAIRVHASGRDPALCGEDRPKSEGESGKPACHDSAEVIAWLDDKLSFDPDLE